MIDITSFGTGIISAIIATATALTIYFRKYRKIVLSLNIDKLKETSAYFIQAISDLKLSDEEKAKIITKLKDSIEEEARIVKIAPDEIAKFKANEIIAEIKRIYPDVQVKAVSDGTYYATTGEKWKEIIKEDFIQRKHYLSEKFDCDDFSRCLVCHIIENYNLNAAGIVYGWAVEGAYHAWNFVFTSDRRILFIEPQSDEIWAPRKEDKKYKPVEIFM